MNKRRYSNRRRKNILRVFILLMTIIITVVMWRTIKIDVQVGELTLPKILQSEKSFADTSGEWNLILVNRNHYIPNNYQVELTELSNGKKVDSRIYPELQQMFNDARAEGLALFVREGYRTTEEQQKIMDEKINEYEKQGYSAKEAKKRAEKYVAIPDTSEHQLGLSVDINADTDKCSSEKVYQWLDENAYKYGFVKRYPEDKTDITGISNEPWHYRYVGTTVAKIMKEENLCLEEYLGQFTRNYTQTVKRAADNKRRYAPGWVHSTCLLRGFPKGAAPHLAHDFAEQSVVCYTLCRRCPENTVAAGEGKGI